MLNLVDLHGVGATMKLNLLTRVTTVALGLIFAPPTFAYIDPGTGSILLQGLIAGIAGGAAVLRIYWFRIKSFFTRNPPASERETPSS